MEQQVLSTLIASLAALVLALLTPFVGIGINWLLKKLKIENEAIRTTAARQAIAFAEEQAAAWAKNQGTKLSGDEKLGTAVRSLLQKIPGIDEVEADRIIHEQLPQVGLGAAGFLQAVAAASKTRPTPPPAQ